MHIIKNMLSLYLNWLMLILTIMFVWLSSSKRLKTIEMMWGPMGDLRLHNGTWLVGGINESSCSGIDRSLMVQKLYLFIYNIIYLFIYWKNLYWVNLDNFKVWTFWLLRLCGQLLRYTSDVPKLHGRYVNP